jgi:hypothetical protein
LFWSIYTTKLEPILPKIPEKEKWWWRASGAPQSRPAALPPDGGAKPAKIEISFRGRVQKNFSIKETIFAGFASLLTQGRAAPTPSRATRGYGSRARRFLPPKPPPRLARSPDGRQKIFRSGDCANFLCKKIRKTI